MGLQFLEQPHTEPDAGLFNLPVGFDREKFVSKWVLKGHAVAQAQQREHLIGSGNITADGWAVFKTEKGAIHSTHTQKGEYVLMFRAREIQEQVNAVYGNVGKKRMMTEKKLAVTSTQESRATGMLSDEQLRAAGYRDEQASQEGEVVLNQIAVEPRVTTSVIETETP